MRNKLDSNVPWRSSLNRLVDECFKLLNIVRSNPVLAQHLEVVELLVNRQVQRL